MPNFLIEEDSGWPYKSIAGVDEAGRGPWAGPVVSAAVVLDKKNIPSDLDDSKKVSEKRRQSLYSSIYDSHFVGVGISSIEEIDNLNILPLICYEIIYSGNLNQNNKDIDFIINISEDGWFGDSIGPHQHFSHSIFRSIEEGKNLARSANNGISAFIDPTGKVTGIIESTDSGVLQINSFKQTLTFNTYVYSNFWPFYHSLYRLFFGG